MKIVRVRSTRHERPNCTPHVTWLIGVVVVSVFTQCSAAADELPAIPFELQPYRVRISLAFADSPELEPGLRTTIVKELPIAADRLLGEMWSVSTEENNWLLPTSAETLAELTPESLPATWLSASHDKTFVITVEHTGGEYVLSGREWDHVGRILGRPMSRRLMQRRELPGAVFDLAHDLFRPLLSIDRITDGVAAVTVRAGALTPADPACTQLKQGQFWQPFLRYRNPQGDVEKWQSVPWTMLQVEAVSNESTAHGQARVVSGLRSALPNRRRPRIDVFARALERDASETELRLVSRQNTARALVGVVVDAKAKPDLPGVRYLTDRHGAVHIATQPGESLLWLYVRSGDKTLARLPLVPGLEPQVTAELPDDSIRLRVEGELSILESNLTDTVAQRAVLIARIRKLVQFNDWKSTVELRKTLRLLPATDFYLKELNAIRIPALKAAQAAKDKAAAAYIERVCGEASKTIQKYLDEDKLRAFEEELKELERAPPIKPKTAETKT